MRTPSRLIPILTLSLLAAIPATLLAEPPGHGHRHGDGPRGGGPLAERMAERLQLTDEQREQIRTIHESRREQAGALFEDLASLRRDLESAIHAEPFDEGTIRAAAGRIAETETEIAIHRARVASEMRQILTPEQYQEAREMRELFQDFAGALHQRHRAFGHRQRPDQDG